MLPITTDFILDALNLACFSDKEESKAILRRIIDIYETAKSRKNQLAADPDMAVIFSVITDLVNNETPLDKKSDRNRIVLKIKASELARKDPMLTDNVAEMLKQGAENGISQKKEELLIKRLQNWASFSIINDKSLDILSMCRKYTATDESRNDLILMNLLDKAGELTRVQDSVIGTIEAQDELDFTSKRSMQLSYTRYDNNRKKNILKLGLQGLNGLFGEAGGVTRGEFVGIAAASHHGKSFTLNNISRWATVYNRYELKDPNKVPTILHITLENNVSNNFITMSNQAYVSANHRPVPKGMPMEELIDFNHEYYNRLGNKLIMRKFNGEDFGFSNLLKLIAHLEMTGHEIVVLVIDYLSLMKPEGNEKNNAAQDLVHLFQRCYDLAQAKDITIFTGIQLDTDAERLIASGEVCPVKKLSAATLSDAKGIKKPLDVLIFQVIENTPDGCFMTWYINKHRDHTLPKMNERFVGYQFLGEELGIIDDLGGRNMSTHDIYATDNSEEKKDDMFGNLKKVA